MKRLSIALVALLTGCATQYDYPTVDSTKAKNEISRLEASLPAKSRLAGTCKEARDNIFRTPNAFNSPYYSRGDIVQLACLYGAVDGVNRDAAKADARKAKVATLQQQMGANEFTRLGYAEMQQQYENGYEAGKAVPTAAELAVMEEDYRERDKSRQKAAERVKPKPKPVKTTPAIPMPECEGIARTLTENAIPRGVTVTMQEFNKTAGELYMTCAIGGNDGHQHKKTMPDWIQYNGGAYLDAYQQGYAIGEQR